MKVREMIERLQTFDGELPVLFYQDGGHGAGADVEIEASVCESVDAYERANGVDDDGKHVAISLP